MNFSISVSGEDCNVPEKHVSLELEDKNVFSVVVGIKNGEIVFGKVMCETLHLLFWVGIFRVLATEEEMKTFRRVLIVIMEKRRLEKRCSIRNLKPPQPK